MTEAMYYLLLALLRPAHGYRLMQQVSEASGGRVTMGAGTMYGLLSKLEKEGLIKLQNQDERKEDVCAYAGGKRGAARGISPSAAACVRWGRDGGGRTVKRSYRFSLPTWAVTQREDYYERMAARGLFVRRCGGIVTSFERGEPQRRLYRLDASQERNTEPPEEQRRLYESCGWTFVCKSDWFNLYTAQPGTEELHTDGEWQSETLRPMRRSLRNDLIAKALYAVFCVVLFLVSSLPFSRGMTLWESVQLTTAALGWLAPITLGYILLQVGSLAFSFAAFSGYVRRLRAGRPRAAVSGRAFVACHMGLNALGVVLLLGVFVLWLAAIPRTVPLEQASGKEHIVRLEQLDPDAELFVGTGNGGIESGTVDCATFRSRRSRWIAGSSASRTERLRHCFSITFEVLFPWICRQPPRNGQEILFVRSSSRGRGTAAGGN